MAWERSGERAESAAHSLLSVGGERGDRIAAAAGKTSAVVVVVTGNPVRADRRCLLLAIAEIARQS